MIKLVCFDLDGVLVSSKKLHFDTFNMALATLDKKYVITEEEQRTIFEARTTREKLKILTELKGLPEDKHDDLWTLKQTITANHIPASVKPDETKQELFKTLQLNNFIVAVCSNTIKSSLYAYLSGLDVLDHIDIIYSNEDVKHPKPHGEIYMRAMLSAGVNATETLIIEDSDVGVKAGVNSGGHVLRVESPSDVTVTTIFKEIGEINKLEQ